MLYLFLIILLLLQKGRVFFGHPNTLTTSLLHSVVWLPRYVSLICLAFHNIVGSPQYVLVSFSQCSRVTPISFSCSGHLEMPIQPWHILVTQIHWSPIHFLGSHPCLILRCYQHYLFSYPDSLTCFLQNAELLLYIIWVCCKRRP
jgi:hypothetical protein